MYKLFIFACILAVAVAAPKPQVFLSPYSAQYTAPLYSGALTYPYPVSAPLTYSGYAAPFSAFSGYSYSVSSSLPYTFYYK